MSDQPRGRVRALAQGRGDGRGIAVPLGLRVAARIQERHWLAFTHDPTQLASGIRDLVDAVALDGVPVTMPAVVTSEAGPVLDRPVVVAALEATRRLRASMGDRMALVACLPGPGALDRGGDDVLDIGKAFLAAGVDVVAVFGDHDGSSQLGRTGSTRPLGHVPCRPVGRLAGWGGLQRLHDELFDLGVVDLVGRH